MSALCGCNCLLLVASKDNRRAMLFKNSDPDIVIDQFVENSFKSTEVFTPEDVSCSEPSIVLAIRYRETKQFKGRSHQEPS